MADWTFTTGLLQAPEWRDKLKFYDPLILLSNKEQLGRLTQAKKNLSTLDEKKAQRASKSLVLMSRWCDVVCMLADMKIERNKQEGGSSTGLNMSTTRSAVEFQEARSVQNAVL